MTRRVLGFATLLFTAAILAGSVFVFHWFSLPIEARVDCDDREFIRDKGIAAEAKHARDLIINPR